MSSKTAEQESLKRELPPQVVRAAKSPLRYPGGKQRAIAHIAAALFPGHVSEYREPMVGGGSVYFYARSVGFAKTYWINDKFRDLILFWKAVQDPQVCEQLRLDLNQLRQRHRTAAQLKKLYLDLKDQEPVDKYELALRFFFFNRVSFSGTTQAGGFSNAASTNRFTESSIERLKPLPSALDGTRITNYDFRDVVAKPGNDVFLFLDPPYFTASKLYGRKGALHDFPHEELANLLRHTSHRFLITYDDCPAIRDLYRWANLELGRETKLAEWQLTYGMNNCNTSNTCKIGSELFISNY